MQYRVFVFLILIVFLRDSFSQNVETGVVVVQFKPEAISDIEAKISRTSNDDVDSFSATSIGLKSFDDISVRYNAGNMRRVFPHGGKYEAKQRKYGLHLWYEIIIPDDADPQKVAASYGIDEHVQIAEPRYKIRRMDMPESNAFNIPNDPEFPRQWNFKNTGQTGGTPGADVSLLEGLEMAKTIGIKNHSIVIAVIDDGVFHVHEDLQANMWVNHAEFNGIEDVDDDNNGYIDDIYGYNFVDNVGRINPEPHATHVAGIIAASTNNNLGIAGIVGDSDDFNIKIMSIQILQGNRYVRNVGPAFVYAANNGAVIAQNSWGYENAGYYQESDVAAINYFINEAGRDENGNPRQGTPMVGGLVIFAAGNDGTDEKWYPAYFDDVLAVAATNHYGKLAWYSNFGSWINISAPGGDTRESGTNRTGGIYSTSFRRANQSFYEYMQGTSMACPHVSGIAALILSVYGSEDYTPDMLRSRLFCTAKPLNQFDPVYASRMGAGLVNAFAAIANMTGSTATKITNMTAETVNAVSAKLTWTFPDDALEYGFYHVAVSENEIITENNFNRYRQLNVYVPFANNANEREIIVTGLMPDTEYNIAIRNFDNCNISEISNTANFTTRDNTAPALVSPFSDDLITIRDVAEETAFFVGNIFHDFDGDKMRYTIRVENNEFASARISADTLYINTIKAGETTLTLTADDMNLGFTDYVFSLIVTQNNPPIFEGLISELTLIPFSKPIEIDLSNFASDPENDTISFRVQATDREILIATVDENILTIDPRGHGYMALRVTVSDTYDATTTEVINITVEQKYAPEISNQLLLYPNPTSDILWYSFVLEQPATVSILIIDTTGRRTFQTLDKNLQQGTYYYNFNFQEWETGLYLVQYIKNGKVVDVKRVVRN